MHPSKVMLRIKKSDNFLQRGITQQWGMQDSKVMLCKKIMTNGRMDGQSNMSSNFFEAEGIKIWLLVKPIYVFFLFALKKGKRLFKPHYFSFLRLIEIHTIFFY